MTELKIAIAQLTSLPDIEKNLADIERYMKQASANNNQWIVLPENCLQMGCVSTVNLEVIHRVKDLFSTWCKKYNLWLFAGTVPVPFEKKAHSTFWVFNHLGHLVETYQKIHLFEANVNDGHGKYREADQFEAGDQLKVVETDFGLVGLAVCYDLRFPEMFRLLKEKGINTLILPAAFVHATGKVHWQILLQARAIENGIYVIGANQCGWHSDKRQTFGYSMVITPWGKISAQAYDKPGLLESTLYQAEIEKAEQSLPSFNHRKFI